MKTKLLITGIGLLVFGLVNFFRYLHATHNSICTKGPKKNENSIQRMARGGISSTIKSRNEQKLVLFWVKIIE